MGERIEPELVALLQEVAARLPRNVLPAAATAATAATVKSFLALVQKKDENVAAIARTRKELAAKQARLRSVLEANGKVSARLAELQSFVSANQQMMDEIMMQRGQVQALVCRVEEAQKDSESAAQRRAALEAQIDDRSGDLSVAVCLGKALRKKVAMHERELAVLAKERRDLEQSLDEARHDLEDRIGDAARIQGELVQALERTAAALITAEAHQQELQDSLERSKQQAISVMHQVAIQDATDTRADKLRRELEEKEGKYPTGNVAIVFTDIQGSTPLWDQATEAMAKSLRIHDNIVRSCAKRCAGYEVKNEGDSFMLAFRSAHDALQSCITVQEELLRADWPQDLLGTKWAAEGSDSQGKSIWRGLRVRMGVHLCTPQTQLNPTTGRVEYVGVAINHAAKIAAKATGGQILASGTTIGGAQDDTLAGVSIEAVGELSLSASRIERLLSVLPAALATRKFEWTEETSSRSSLTTKYERMEVDPIETKLDHILTVIEKTMHGEVDRADVDEPQSEEAARSRLRVVAAQLAEMREKIATISRQRDEQSKKLTRKRRKTEGLRDELRERRAERDLYRQIADEYTTDKRSKDEALIKANAVTFCLLLKGSMLQQQLQAITLEKELYERQRQNVLAAARRFGLTRLEELDTLSSEQLAELEAGSLKERNTFLEASLHELVQESENNEHLIQDLTRSLAELQQQEAQQALLEKQEEEKRAKAAQAAEATPPPQQEPASTTAETLLESQADLQEELAVVTTELGDLERQSRLVEERIASMADIAAASAGPGGGASAEALWKKQALLKYRVAKAASEKRRLERQLETLLAIREEERALTEEVMQKQAQHAATIERKVRAIEGTAEKLVPST